MSFLSGASAASQGYQKLPEERDLEAGTGTAADDPDERFLRFQEVCKSQLFEMVKCTRSVKVFSTRIEHGQSKTDVAHMQQEVDALVKKCNAARLKMRDEVREIERFLNLRRYDRPANWVGTEQEWNEKLYTFSTVPDRIANEVEKKHNAFRDALNQFNQAKRVVAANHAVSVTTAMSQKKRTRRVTRVDEETGEEITEEVEVDSDDGDYQTMITARDRELAQRQKQLDLVDSSLDTHTAIVQEHVDGIKEIETSMAEIMDIMTDMASAVKEQGELVDNIANTVDEADTIVDQALEHLVAAQKHSKKALRKYMLVFCIIMCTIIILAVIAAKVLITSILKIYMKS
ncbi:SNARE domain [Carpediemonas membranifera]|uniref:SNARE domain n=1 Tax=Carpediemonas membranifera TaxID=201153 RepID=A0A8J6B7K6_9EUKA|nr:SNARE domain [Carpediemonas membranifera]|eukprot:KAG9394397.1 SNARE domain [Carpediemonas membranifera]